MDFEYLLQAKHIITISVFLTVFCIVLAILYFTTQETRDLSEQNTKAAKALNDGMTTILALEFVSRPIYQYYINRKSRNPIAEYDRFIATLSPEVIAQAKQIFESEPPPFTSSTSSIDK